MNRVAVSFLLVFGSVCAFADAGPSPDVQAVCKVTLKNGQVVEGIILVATGYFLSPDDQSYYNTNGFLLTFDNGEKMPVLFNADFKAIEPHKGRVRDPKGRESTRTDPLTKVFFLHDVTPRSGWGSYETDLNENIVGGQPGTALLLRREIIHHIDYELLDSVPVFATIPKELFLRFADPSVKPVLINVNDIDTFELYREPPKKWLDRIARAEKAWRERHSDPMDETFPPRWYHRYVKLEGTARMFKPWKF